MEKENRKYIIEMTNEKDDKQINLAKSIKSLLIFKNIISFLDDKIKLDIIIYNKNIQNILGINIENYKKISGKYIKEIRNGKGKEYELDSNILLFEGEYKNGKKNGNGKEYYNNNKLKYEGEYKNGKRNGKGKEYNNKGKLVFEGEYKNGIKIKGIGYNSENRKIL